MALHHGAVICLNVLKRVSFSFGELIRQSARESPCAEYRSNRTETCSDDHFGITFQNRSSAVDPEPQVRLEDILPLAFTRLCEPKEASYSLIRKYVSQYYPKLRVDIR